MCFENRSTPVCCIAIFSALVLIGGVLMLFFTVKVTGMDLVDELSKTEGFERLDDVKGLFFAILLAFSIITICLAMCGFCCRCFVSRRWAFVYGIILLPTWIVLVSFGAVFVGMSVWGKEKIETECEKLSDLLSINFTKDIADRTIDIDINL